jgi:hypothetical protein
MEQRYSPQAINAYMREQMTKLLHANDIYAFDAYGWIDADTHDPEMVGHAMHQVDSLSWRFREAAMACPNPLRLERWAQRLVISGGDFEGLMKAARLSIGVMLFQDSLVTDHIDASDSLFQLHLMSAMILLNIASDRLRDFFIAAAFRKTTGEYTGDYKKSQNKRPSYSKPFHQARERLQHPLSAPAGRLCGLAGKIQKFRSGRNEIVHDVATELGRLEELLVDNPPSRAHEDQFDWEEITDEMIQRFSEETKVAHQKRISYPMDWYRLLIDASNYVFIIENTLRQAAAELPATELQE